ncbi:outer membrane beta-barrel protein [Polaribacter vadi]|uniref:outer membrane beta-barrel protein n=1 Tax=Polaribacter vadi TaxID=1774273 RepID=UPI0030EECECB|tara:strand:- start:1519 stop:2805 length:1287 start_codon:yes stop_codon:yes gene_type:complete
MEDKKIDDLFKNQLKNLEVSPNKKVWNSIETKLKKKKRRVFPFWLFSGAAVAILVLGLFFYPFSTNENQHIIPKIDEVITTSPTKKPLINTTIDTLILQNNKVEQVLKTNQNAIVKTEIKEEKWNTNNTKKEFVARKNPAKTTFLKPFNIDENLTSNQQIVILQIEKITDYRASEKMDFNAFLATKETQIENKEIVKNWSVAPTFGVLQSNSFSNTSPIAEDLANTTTGENSFSYGLQVGYKLNKRWTIQSGIHLQEMKYSNNQITVYPSEIANLQSVAFNDNSSVSFNNSVTENLSIMSNLFTNFVKSTGNLSQNFGYIEIPLEMKYNFSNNTKIEAQLVTGFSSLFLDKNKVVLNTFNTTRTGELTTLNNINFSGNLGFDFNYYLNSNWSLNINPMFKVQLNTFKTEANGFAPFNLGIYSGIKYQF